MEEEGIQFISSGFCRISRNLPAFKPTLNANLHLVTRQAADTHKKTPLLAIYFSTLLTLLSILPAAPAFAQTIQDIISQVSQSQYQTYQQVIENAGLGLYDPAYNQGYRNRDGWSGGGSVGNEEAGLYLNDEFSRMGLSVTVQGSYKNIVAEHRGVSTPEKIYIIGGHYDTTSGNETPGGDDNASGTAGVLEAARVLSKYSFESTIRFIGFNAEEDWMLGSQDYVDNVVTLNNENIAGMINLDMILRPAWDSDASQPEDLDLSTANTALCLNWADIFITAAQTYVSSLNIDSGTPHTANPAAGDQGPFINAGYPAFMAIENTPDEIWVGKSNAYYHLSDDASNGLANDPFSPSGVTYNYGFATDVVRATVAAIALEAGFVPEPATVLLLTLGAMMLRKKR